MLGPAWDLETRNEIACSRSSAFRALLDASARDEQEGYPSKSRTLVLAYSRVAHLSGSRYC